MLVNSIFPQEFYLWHFFQNPWKTAEKSWSEICTWFHLQCPQTYELILTFLHFYFQSQFSEPCIYTLFILMAIFILEYILSILRKVRRDQHESKRMYIHAILCRVDQTVHIWKFYVRHWLTSGENSVKITPSIQNPKLFSICIIHWWCKLNSCEVNKKLIPYTQIAQPCTYISRITRSTHV